jgi:hypothetical protein
MKVTDMCIARMTENWKRAVHICERSLSSYIKQKRVLH